MDQKVVARNRKAKFDYFLLEHYEAGIALKGSEIKSIRAGQASLTEAYVDLINNQAWLIDAHVAPYDAASINNHDPRRPRRLLLKKKELADLWSAIRIKGMTIVPVQIYLKNGLAKLDIALAKGKRQYDKRQSIAKRDSQREIDREKKQRS